MGNHGMVLQQNLIFILKDDSSCYVIRCKSGSSEASKEAIAVDQTMIEAAWTGVLVEIKRSEQFQIISRGKVNRTWCMEMVRLKEKKIKISS